MQEDRVTKLDLYSMRRLEKTLAMSREDLDLLAKNCSAYYQPFCLLPKPLPFPKLERKRKIRVIDNPKRLLKVVQSRVYRKLLNPLLLPAHVYGGVPRKSIGDNVKLHKNAKVLVKIDVKNFFPSITWDHVYKVWREVLNCTPRIARLLTDLTIYDNHLPQGAPTSTHLANLVLLSLDGNSRAACSKRGVVYSTFVDDISLSGDQAPNMIRNVVESLRRGGLAVSHKKLKVMRAGSRKELHGQHVGPHPTIPRQFRSQVRSGIHKLRKGLVDEEQLTSYVRALSGKINYIGTVNVTQGHKLATQLNDAISSIGLM